MTRLVSKLQQRTFFPSTSTDHRICPCPTASAVLTFARDFLERDQPQDMRDAVEPRPPLVVGAYDVPWRMRAYPSSSNIMSRARE